MTVAIPTGTPIAPALVGREPLEIKAAQFYLRALRAEDLDEWRTVYAQFAEHYTVPVRVEDQDRVWSWLMDPDHPLEVLAAIDPEGRIRGLAHFRAFPRPLAGSTGCFLDDLVVDRSAHGSGAADALLHGVRQIAAERGWTVVRWLTADNNYRARRLYDAFALRTMWVVYDMAPSEVPDEKPGRPDRGQNLVVRPVREDDREQWCVLYTQYAEHYRVPVSAEHQDVVWSWLRDPSHSEECLVAEGRDGRLLGLAHFRPFTRPLAASVGCFLDDLVVNRADRGNGASDALLRALRETARSREWTVVRWITADDNHRARSVYDAYATRTMWVIYDMTPGTLPESLKGVLR